MGLCTIIVASQEYNFGSARVNSSAPRRTVFSAQFRLVFASPRKRSPSRGWKTPQIISNGNTGSICRLAQIDL